MAKPYDSIFKEIFERVVPELAVSLLHLPWGETEELKDKLQVTREQEADYLKKLVFKDSNQACIFHAEFQVKEEDRRSWMLLERALLRNKYGLEVRQVVFFLGNKKKPWYPKSIKELNLETSFDVIVVKNVPVEIFLKSQIPEVVMLAILSDFGEQEPASVIESVLQKLQELSGNQYKFQQLVNQLERLSNLRKLQPLTVKSLEAMPLTIEDVIGKIENDRLYKQGLEQGREEGQQETAEKFITGMLLDGTYSIERISVISGETVESILSIKRKLEQTTVPPVSTPKKKTTRKPPTKKNGK
ncbi:MAG: hypothetical protein MUC59_00870 [Saprospiraceae bacterium]|jgi:hypothetical protein|nr:hypothetical protein [Saprospiraceae bacterium]